MTIKQYREQCEKTGAEFFDFISTGTEIWQNGSCLGYVIMALEKLQKDDTEIAAVVNEIKVLFDSCSVDEADRHYCQSNY